MRSLLILLVSATALYSQVLQAGDEPNARQIKALFFGHDHRRLVADPAAAPWQAIGQLETKSGNLCTATLITRSLAITAGHCLLIPPHHFDPPVALRFVANKHGFRYQLQDIKARVAAHLLGKLKADGDGWIVPDMASPLDYALIYLPHPLPLQPIPLLSVDEKKLQKTLISYHNRVTQAGYPIDHLDQLYIHSSCLVTSWAQPGVINHRCDTLAGDSGSPLILKTYQGWRIIAIQSSAPAASERDKADNKAVAVSGFIHQLSSMAQTMAGQSLLTDFGLSEGKASALSPENSILHDRPFS